MELSGGEACRSYIEAAQPEHPSLVDQTHQMATLLRRGQHPERGVDRRGRHDRAAARAGLAGADGTPGELAASRVARAPRSPTTNRPRTQRAREESEAAATRQRANLMGGQDRDAYPDAIRDWVEKGAASEFATLARRGRRALATAADVEVGRCRALRAGRPPLARRRARRGDRALQRVPPAPARELDVQAPGLVAGRQRAGRRQRVRPVHAGPAARAARTRGRSTPTSATDVAKLGPGEYYPKTM